MYNSHYVPQFILKSFGNHFDLYIAKEQKINNGLISTQAFVIRGLYDNELEKTFNHGFEQAFAIFMNESKTIGSEDIKSRLNALHNYIVVSFLRTPYVAGFFDKAEWIQMLKQIITEGFDSYPFGKLTAEQSMVIEQARFLNKANIYQVRSTADSDTFIISDKGVSFIDDDTAIYPYSPHEALLMTLSTVDYDTIGQNEVENINGFILSDFYKILGLPSLEDDCRSISAYGKNNPSDKRTRKLVLEAFKLSDPELSWNQQIRKNSGIRKIIIPKQFIEMLDKGEDSIDLEQLRDESDYDTLSALAILNRFGITSIPSENIESLIENSSEIDFQGCVKQYRDSPMNEFQKCQGVIFMEITSKHGNNKDTDRLRRYYKEGKHVVKDLEKSDYYMIRGCKQYHEDCLVAYCSKLYDDVDYEKKINRFRKQFDASRGPAALSVSDLYKKHGNEEKSIKYLKQAAHCGYVGAVSKYLAYLLKQEPYDLAEIEAMELHTVNKQLNSIFILADFYYTHQDLCPGKIDWLLDVIRHSDNIYAADVLKKYEKRD